MNRLTTARLMRRGPLSRRVDAVVDSILSVAGLRNLVLGFYIFFISAPKLFYPMGNAQIDFESETQGSALTQIVMLSCLAFAVFVALNSRTAKTKLFPALVPYLPLMIVATLSIFWATYESLAFRRVLRMLVEITTLALLASSFPDRRSLFRVLYWTFALVVFVDLVEIVIPGSFTPIGFEGVHNHKSSAGAVTFFELPLFVLALADGRFARNRNLTIGLIIATIGLMVLTESKTAMGTTAGCAAFVVVVRMFHSKWWRGMTIGVLAIAFAAVVTVYFSEHMVPGDISTAITGDPTFTDRQYVWNYTIRRIEQAPFLGYGFGSFWGTGHERAWLAASEITFAFGEAHNGYLDIAAQIGLVGLLAMFYAIFIQVMRLPEVFRSGTLPELLFYSYVTVSIVVYSTMESIFFRPGIELWVYYLVASQSMVLPDFVRPDSPQRPRRAAVGRRAWRQASTTRLLRR